jgi:hypothetical protein
MMIKRALSFSLFLLLTVTFSAFSQEVSDRAVLKAFLDYAGKEKIKEKETGERVALIARYFLGTPYIASTLEAEGPERFQVNLRELDCTTFVENVLALHNLLKEHTPDYDTFTRILTKIRYRNGVIDGYPSRLHYTTDWLLDNKKKGFIRFVKMGSASEIFRPNLYFMTTHPALYPALKNNSEFVKEMAKHEARLSKESLRYLPKEKLTDEAPFIHTGDIIAITTATPGIDFAHLGIALREQGVVYLLHASSLGKKVLISDQSLKSYLSGISHHTGIVVIRPV